VCNKISIVFDRELCLNASANHIKRKIKADRTRTYSVLKVKRGKLRYRTEGIYPKRAEHLERIPVLFLFSNPHPESVKRCLFLSEPHSWAFWQRLSEIDKEYLVLLPTEVNLEHWDESIPRLKDTMLNGNYKSPFLFYFHCYYPIPTRQLVDLKRLFKSAPSVWDVVKKSALEELTKLVKREQIKYIVVFSVEIFREITNRNRVKGWRNKEAINKFLKSDCKEKYWGVDSNLGRVYLALHTRAKDWKNDNEQYYFTQFLELIFKKIKETHQVI